MNQTENPQTRAQQLADEWVRLVLTHNPQILLGTSITHYKTLAGGGDKEYDGQSVHESARAVVEFHSSLVRLLSEKQA